MENNWMCKKCYYINFQVNMSNCDCPRCGSSNIERVPYEELEKLYTIEEFKEYLEQQTSLDAAIYNLSTLNDNVDI